VRKKGVGGNQTPLLRAADSLNIGETVLDFFRRSHVEANAVESWQSTSVQLPRQSLRADPLSGEHGSSPEFIHSINHPEHRISNNQLEINAS
jgi:hypothetical protein